MKKRTQIDVLPTPEVLTSIIEQLGFEVVGTARSFLLEIIVGEYFRAWLTPRNVNNSSSFPLSRGNLISRVHAQLNSVISDDTEASLNFVKRIYFRLRETRELTELPGRMVQLSPFRLVPLTNGNHLIIGGADTFTVTRERRIEPFVSSFTRLTVQPATFNEDSEYEIQSLPSWAGIPALSLPKWHEAITLNSNGDYETGSGGEEGQYFYDHLKNGRRWQPLNSIKKTSNAQVLLRRKQGLRYLYSYAEFKIESSGVRITRRKQLSHADAFRLQYAIDMIMGSSLTAAFENRKNDCLLHLERRLPLEEQRILSSLAFEVKSSVPHKKVYVFDKKWKSIIESLCLKLGITTQLQKESESV